MVPVHESCEEVVGINNKGNVLQHAYGNTWRVGLTIVAVETQQFIPGVHC